MCSIFHGKIPKERRVFNGYRSAIDRGQSESERGEFILNQDHNRDVSALNPEKENAKPITNLYRESDTPLFLRDSSEGQRGNAQDEKDGIEE